jgi:hypothetical protein
MSWQSIEMYKTKEINFIDCGVQINMKILSLRMTNTEVMITHFIILSSRGEFQKSKSSKKQKILINGKSLPKTFT